MGFNGSEFGFKPCPKCGQTELNISAFSIVPDCIIECTNCGFSIESEVSWKDCDSQSEHDQKCVEHLKELWNKMKMKLWIARDRNKSLWFYEEKPLYNMEKGKFEGDLILIPMDDDIFPEVTFENSPQEVELKLVEK